MGIFQVKRYNMQQEQVNNIIVMNKLGKKRKMKTDNAFSATRTIEKLNLVEFYSAN